VKQSHFREISAQCATSSVTKSANRSKAKTQTRRTAMSSRGIAMASGGSRRLILPSLPQIRRKTGLLGGWPPTEQVVRSRVRSVQCSITLTTIHTSACSCNSPRAKAGWPPSGQQAFALADDFHRRPASGGRREDPPQHRAASPTSN
jgi:hypothetical protein